MRCALCDGPLDQGARRAMLAGDAYRVCGWCSRLLSTLEPPEKAAAGTCLHIAAMEVERLAEWVGTIGPEGPGAYLPHARASKSALPGFRKLFDDGAYRARCSCVDCAMVRNQVRIEHWGDCSDPETGEQMSVMFFTDLSADAVPDPEEPFSGVRMELLSPEEAAIRREYNRWVTQRPPLEPNGLGAMALPARERTEGEWRFPKNHRFEEAGPPVGSRFSGYFVDGEGNQRRKSVAERVALSVAWSALSATEREWHVSEWRRENSRRKKGGAENVG